MLSQAQTFQINTILLNEIIGSLRLVLFMVLNASFNNISVISWGSVLLVDPEKNHRPVASHWQTLEHNVVSSTPRHEWDCLRHEVKCHISRSTIPLCLWLSSNISICIFVYYLTLEFCWGHEVECSMEQSTYP